MFSTEQLAENREKLRQAMVGREAYGVFWNGRRVEVRFRDGYVLELDGYEVGCKSPAAYALAQLCREAGFGSAEEAMELVRAASDGAVMWIAGEQARPLVPVDPEDEDEDLF